MGKIRPYLSMEGGGATVAVLVDSESTAGLTLRESDVHRWAVEPWADSASARYSRIHLDHAGRLAEDVVYGPLILEQPIVEVIEKGRGLSGEELMRGFVCGFDQSARRIRMFAESKEPIRTAAVRGTGIALWPTRSGLDAVPVYERGRSSLNDLGDGDAVVMSIVRDGEETEVRIPVRVLVP